MKKRIPSTFQPFLWSKSTEKIERDQDKVYIIHQILSYGGLKDLRLLFQIYDRKEIKDVFLRSPKKIYQPSVFFFVKDHILGLKKERLRERNYVKTLF